MDLKDAADDLGPPPHIGKPESASGVVTGEPVAVVANPDVNVLAGSIHTRLHLHGARAGMLENGGEGFLEDAQDVQHVLRRHAGELGDFADSPVEVDALLLEALVEPVA